MPLKLARHRELHSTTMPELDWTKGKSEYEGDWNFDIEKITDGTTLLKEINDIRC